MASLFISYSRKDIETARKLTKAFEGQGLDFWIDWEGIPPTVDWWNEIQKGIEEADIFLFLISPDSIKSKICLMEIGHAVNNGKRLIPIIARNIKGNEAPPELKHINWIYFRKIDDFDASIVKLFNAIKSDYDWAQAHRRLQVKALDWERSHKDSSFLLRGKDLQDAEQQLVVNSSKEPDLTHLQNEYVSESRKTENMQQRLSRRRGIVATVIGAVLLILTALAMTGQLKRFIYRPVDMEGYWVTIPAGEFQMGTGKDPVPSIFEGQPVHAVFVDEFQIGKYEVTNRQYSQCVNAGRCRAVQEVAGGKDKELHPVVYVSWYDAKAFCEWVGGRLPTEAEWEKAASWDDTTKTKSTYPWGETIDCSYANYFGKDGGNGFCVGDTTPVGSYESGKNPYGLYDMGGNVWEWVSSLIMPYPYDAKDGREDMNSKENRVLRGSAWNNYGQWVGSARRNGNEPTGTLNSVGFRCSRDSPP